MNKVKILTAVLLLALLCACSEKAEKKETPEIHQPECTLTQETADNTAEQSKVTEPEEKKQRAKAYADILSSGKYYIDCTAEIEYEGMTLSNPMLIAVEGENSSITISSDLSGTMVTMRTLTLDGVVYMINDAARSFTEIPLEQTANSFDTDWSGMEYDLAGEEEFCGEMLEYEQYLQDGRAVKFFLDGDRLVGIGRATEDGEMTQTNLRINAISQNIPDRLIAYPIGYQKQ